MTQQLQPLYTIQSSSSILSTSFFMIQPCSPVKRTSPSLPHPHLTLYAPELLSAHIMEFHASMPLHMLFRHHGMSRQPWTIPLLWKPNSTITPFKMVSLARKTVNHCFLMPPLHHWSFCNLSTCFFYWWTSCRLGLSPALRPSQWCNLMHVLWMHKDWTNG